MWVWWVIGSSGERQYAPHSWNTGKMKKKCSLFFNIIFPSSGWHEWETSLHTNWEDGKHRMRLSKNLLVTFSHSILHLFILNLKQCHFFQVFRSIGSHSTSIDEKIPFDDNHGIVPNTNGRVDGRKGKIVPVKYKITQISLKQNCQWFTIVQ